MLPGNSLQNAWRRVQQPPGSSHIKLYHYKLFFLFCKFSCIKSFNIFNLSFGISNSFSLNIENTLLQDKLNELNAELEWYKQKYLELKFQEMEVKNNG